MKRCISSSSRHLTRCQLDSAFCRSTKRSFRLRSNTLPLSLGRNSSSILMLRWTMKPGISYVRWRSSSMRAVRVNSLWMTHGQGSLLWEGRWGSDSRRSSLIGTLSLRDWLGKGRSSSSRAITSFSMSLSLSTWRAVSTSLKVWMFIAQWPHKERSKLKPDWMSEVST